MLHELLFALFGHSGGLFKETETGIKNLCRRFLNAFTDGADTTSSDDMKVYKQIKGEDDAKELPADLDSLQLLTDFPFLHPSEISQLDHLCEIATLYKRLSDFCHTHTTAHVSQKTDGSSNASLHGLYLSSFCHAIEQELDIYRAWLCELERNILKDEHLSLSYIICYLDEYFFLFPALWTVVSEIQAQKAHGCYILELVYKHSNSGLQSVKTALRSILQHCHKVLYKQLCGWLLYGYLFDPHSEFFIQKDKSIKAAIDTTDGEDDLSGLIGTTPSQLQRLLDSSTSVSSSRHQFALQVGLLPSYLPIGMADKILFIGESMQMFENNNDLKQPKKSSSFSASQERYTKELYDLAQLEEFNLMRFEAVIDDIRACVAERLCVLIIEESDLIGQLRLLKDFYLLGRGELYQVFIDQAQALLHAPPTPTTDYDVNAAFQQAARNLHIQDEALLQRFQLTITKPAGSDGSSGSSSSSKANESGWHSLNMTYLVQWPFQVLFTPAILDRYNTVFRFLLSVRRAQLQLHQCWLMSMQGSMHGTDTLRNTNRTATWQLRTHLAFLIDNLQYYMQVDMIESLFGVLIAKIESTRDFEAVRLAHEQFVSGLLAQSFIHVKALSVCLTQILQLCSSFSQIVLNAGSTPMSSSELSRLEGISKSVQRQSSLLFTLLSSVKSHSASPHLAQLLLRLDYNHYLSLKKGQLGT